MKEDLSGYAYRLLARRSYTLSGMAKKLKGKGEPEDVRAVLDQLAESGYLDDYSFARDYIHSRCALRPSGRALLEMKLRSKGVPAAIVREVLNELKPEEEEKMAEDLAKKKAALLRNLEPEDRRQRLYRFLLNRGFSPNIAEKYAKL